MIPGASEPIKSIKCCTDRGTQCPTVMAMPDGTVLVMDDFGNCIKLTNGAQADAVAVALGEATDALDSIDG